MTRGLACDSPGTDVSFILTRPRPVVKELLLRARIEVELALESPLAGNPLIDEVAPLSLQAIAETDAIASEFRKGRRTLKKLSGQPIMTLRQ